MTRHVTCDWLVQYFHVAKFANPGCGNSTPIILRPQTLLPSNILATSTCVMYHISLRLCCDVSGHAVTLSQHSDTPSFWTLHNLHSFKIHMLHPLHDPLRDPCHHSRFCGNTIIFCYISFLWLTIVLLLWLHLLTILTFITYSGISDVLYKSLVASGQNSSL